MISKNQLKYIKKLEQKKFRSQDKVFVAEGPKVVGDLLKCGFQPVEIFATEAARPSFSAWNDSATIVSEDELRKASFLQHPQQVMAIFRMPENDAAAPLYPSKGLSLALDGVQDPGNMGTIIRIADWFGIDTIYCSQDCADVWSPKVVQATMGSIARIRIITTDLKSLLTETPLPVFGTLLDGNDIYQQSLPTDAIIVMGNEGKGISEPIREMITRRLLIPAWREGAESLNVAVATAITCAEFRRQGSSGNR